MTDDQLERLARYAAERDEALIDFTMNGSTEKLMDFIRRYKLPMPDRKDVLAAGVYKAVQECTMIPEAVKEEARRKCIALGYKPTMMEGDG